MVEAHPEIDRYLASLPEDRRVALQTLREWIREALPDAEEVITYRMPGIKQGDVVCSYKSQKHHMSLYMDVDVVDTYRAQLGGVDCGKSCIRFKRIEHLPRETIQQMLKETVLRRNLM